MSKNHLMGIDLGMGLLGPCLSLTREETVSAQVTQDKAQETAVAIAAAVRLLLEIAH